MARDAFVPSFGNEFDRDVEGRTLMSA